MQPWTVAESRHFPTYLANARADLDALAKDPRARGYWVARLADLLARRDGTPRAGPKAPPAGPGRPDLVAPGGCRDRPGSHEHTGRAAVKPWQYRATVTVPVLDTPESAALVVQLLRLQRERPYVLLVDTGSSPENFARLEALRAEDVEVHAIRGHAYHHSSEPVTLACDFAMIRCHTEHLIFTHADCFLRRREAVGDLIARCGPETPVVGYQLTDREVVTREWRWMVGHTWACLHMPTAAAAGVLWGMLWNHWRGSRPAEEHYFDTEIDFNWGCRRAGLPITLIGTEENFARNVTADFDHVRSWATKQLYAWVGAADWRPKVEAWYADATAGAAARIAAWEAEDRPAAEPAPRPVAALAAVAPSPLAVLSEAQLAAVAGCRHRKEETACCGPVDRCRAPGHPRHGWKVMTADCAESMAAGQCPG